MCDTVIEYHFEYFAQSYIQKSESKIKRAAARVGEALRADHHPNLRNDHQAGQKAARLENHPGTGGRLLNQGQTLQRATLPNRKKNAQESAIGLRTTKVLQ